MRGRCGPSSSMIRSFRSIRIQKPESRGLVTPTRQKPSSKQAESCFATSEGFLRTVDWEFPAFDNWIRRGRLLPNCWCQLVANRSLESSTRFLQPLIALCAAPCQILPVMAPTGPGSRASTLSLACRRACGSGLSTGGAGRMPFTSSM
jgi:hypothetical protein